MDNSGGQAHSRLPQLLSSRLGFLLLFLAVICSVALYSSSFHSSSATTTSCSSPLEPTTSNPSSSTSTSTRVSRRTKGPQENNFYYPKGNGIEKNNHQNNGAPQAESQKPIGRQIEKIREEDFHKRQTTTTCLYVTNYSIGKVQWFYEDGTLGVKEGNDPSQGLHDGLVVGRLPTGVEIVEDQLLVCFDFDPVIKIYNITAGLSELAEIKDPDLDLCKPSAIAYEAGVLYAACSYDFAILRFQRQDAITYTKLSPIDTGPLEETLGGLVAVKNFGPPGALFASTTNFMFLLNESLSYPMFKLPESLPPQPENETFADLIGLDIGSDGNIYVVSNRHSIIYRFPFPPPPPPLPGDPLPTAEELVNFRAEYPDEGYLSDFIDLKFGWDGDIFVSSQREDSIERFSSSGEYIGTFVGGPNATSGLSIPQMMVFGLCPVLVIVGPPDDTGDGGQDLTYIIVLATVLPWPFLFCMLATGTLIGYIIYRRYKRRRRDWEEDEEMGESMIVGSRKYVYREIEPEDLEIGPLLGKGAFGKVYKGAWRGAPVAIKLFDAVELNEADENTLDEIRKEAELMEKLGNHPNVINFVGAITRQQEGGKIGSLALVTEFCQRGSLFDLLVKKKRRIPLPRLIGMARDAAAGILHLHREHVIHRDIAARNCLVGDNYNVYISDFGLARVKMSDSEYTTKSNIGPVKWMAPEAITKREYSEASDAFSFGVLLWEMVTRKLPWRGVDPMKVMILVSQKNTRLKIPSTCDPILKKIMNSVWKENPQQRMKFTEIVTTLTEYHELLTKYTEHSDEEMISEEETETDVDEVDDDTNRNGGSNDTTRFSTATGESGGTLSNTSMGNTSMGNTSASAYTVESYSVPTSSSSSGNSKQPLLSTTPLKTSAATGKSSQSTKTATTSSNSKGTVEAPSIVAYELPNQSGAGKSNEATSPTEAPSVIGYTIPSGNSATGGAVEAPSVVGYTIPSTNTTSSPSTKLRKNSNPKDKSVQVEAPSVIGYTIPSATTATTAAASPKNVRLSQKGNKAKEVEPAAEATSVIGYTIPSATSTNAASEEKAMRTSGKGKTQAKEVEAPSVIGYTIPSATATSPKNKRLSQKGKPDQVEQAVEAPSVIGYTIPSATATSPKTKRLSQKGNKAKEVEPEVEAPSVVGYTIPSSSTDSSSTNGKGKRDSTKLKNSTGKTKLSNSSGNGKNSPATTKRKSSKQQKGKKEKDDDDEVVYTATNVESPSVVGYTLPS